MDQMVENMRSQDASIEERLIDQVGDAIGGKGSISLISGGSVDQRHSIIAHVLEEAEAMGCLTAVCDCKLSISRMEPLMGSLSAINSNQDGKGVARSPPMLENKLQAERSYREEMYTLSLLRSVTAENTVVVVVEEIGKADMATIIMFCFLARNIGGMNALIIATHRSVSEDQVLVERLEDVRRDILVHDLHLHAGDGDQNESEAPTRHEHTEPKMEAGAGSLRSPIISQIIGNIVSSKAALESSNVPGSINDAKAALGCAMAIDHYGLQLDSSIALGMALTQAGREKESLDVLDHAIDLATTVGEPLSQFLARIRRSELLLFSVGEPDSAFVEAASAGELWSQTREEALRIEPLALMAIVEARNGRKDRAEKAFCDAAGLLEKQPVDKLVLERMMLSLAAAMLLESRHDLNGMNARYGEAMVLAAGTDSPEYWGATISLQHGRSLLRLSRPKEARAHLEEASRRFDRLGNAVQSARIKRAVEESKVGPVLD